jgi:hypothetical protein
VAEQLLDSQGLGAVELVSFIGYGCRVTRRKKEETRQKLWKQLRPSVGYTWTEHNTRVKLDVNNTAEGTATHRMRWRCQVDTMDENKWQMEL